MLPASTQGDRNTAATPAERINRAITPAKGSNSRRKMMLPRGKQRM